jgi:hypothetical protein
VTVDASGHYLTVHIVAEPARPGEAPADPESQSTSGPKLTSVPTT